VKEKEKSFLERMGEQRTFHMMTMAILRGEGKTATAKKEEGSRQRNATFAERKKSELETRSVRTQKLGKAIFKQEKKLSRYDIDTIAWGKIWGVATEVETSSRS